jgi:hypothetical protein
METKNTKTLQEEFDSGLKSGQHPHPENTLKAITAVTRKPTEPHVRAYWSGYFCALSQVHIVAV